MKCSESSCNDDAMREIDIQGRSPFTERTYTMSVYVCIKHLELEQEEGNVLKVRLLK